MTNNYAARRLHEAFFSLNFGLSVTALVVYGLANAFNWDFSKTDGAVQRFTHLTIPEFATVNWFFLPTLTVCIYLLLKIYPDTKVTRGTLDYASAILAVGAAPVWFLSRSRLFEWKYFWTALQGARFCELVIALVCLALYLRRKWPVPVWGNVLLLSAHYTFWLWQFWAYLRGYWAGLQAFFRPALEAPGWLTKAVHVLEVVVEQGWSNQVAVVALLPVVGFLSGFAWALYASKERSMSRVPIETAP